MENYSYSSYPDSSAASSPRSLETSSFDETPTYKVKFICSYNGQIQPRPHDNNHLTYLGGDTKILAVERHITYTTFSSKLSVLAGADASVSVKYQLPGEDLDALISVTNDEDLHHLMAEYDRLPKSARLRLFLFPGGQTFGGGDSNSERQWFADALNSVQIQPQENRDDTDFLFGLDSGTATREPPVAVDRAKEAVAAQAEIQSIQFYGHEQGFGNSRAYIGDYYAIPQQHQYWQDHRHMPSPNLQEQPYCVIQTPSGTFQSTALRPMDGQLPAQGFYSMPPVYNSGPRPQMYYTTAVAGPGVVPPQYRAVAVAATAVHDSGKVVGSKASSPPS